MITDQRQSATVAWLSQLSPVFREAFQWIAGLPDAPADGITELRGRAMYGQVMGYDTKPPTDCRWESHRHTIDIQYIFEGGETIDYVAPGVLAPMDDYAEARDVEHWHPTTPPMTTLRMAPGAFVIFLPGEPHRPKGLDGTHAGVRKVVIKIDSSLVSGMPA